MAKRNSDGDVLANQFSVMLAHKQRTRAFELGSKSGHDSKQEAVRDDRQEDDFKDEALGHDRLGVSGIVPKDIRDGSFTKGAIISKDKLLEQLMGKKAAKAHIAAKQAPRTATKTPKPEKPLRTTKAEEIDEEDEGRAAMFKSKRRRISKSTTAENEEHVARGGAPEAASKPIAAESEQQLEFHEASDITSRRLDQGRSDHADEQPKSRSQKQKPSSYLDEILAERSKKKRRKKGKRDKM